jgi:hypothetical protein
MAEWMVSDEMELPHVIKGNHKYVRAKTIASYNWCSWHYQPSKIFDKKGELISEWEEACGVRPQ